MQMQLDDIQFEEKLGSGGFGEVYKATAEHFSGPVAIKLLKVPDESARTCSRSKIIVVPRPQEHNSYPRTST